MSKKLDKGSLEFRGIKTWSNPDLSDVYVISAKWEDGTYLTDEELDNISHDIIDDVLIDRLYNNRKY